MISDGAYLLSFGIQFQIEEEAKENERSPRAALLWIGREKTWCVSHGESYGSVMTFSTAY